MKIFGGGGGVGVGLGLLKTRDPIIKTGLLKMEMQKHAQIAVSSLQWDFLLLARYLYTEGHGYTEMNPRH